MKCNRLLVGPRGQFIGLFLRRLLRRHLLTQLVAGRRRLQCQLGEIVTSHHRGWQFCAASAFNLSPLVCEISK